MFDFVLNVDETSDIFQKLKGSRPLMKAISDDIKKEIQKTIDKSDMRAKSKNGNLDSIWYEAETGMIQTSPVKESFEIFNKKDVKENIEVNIKSGTNVEIKIDMDGIDKFKKGGNVFIKRKNPSFETNIDKYIKSNKDKLSLEKINSIRNLKSLSQISVVVPQVPFEDYNEKRAEKIIKEYLES